MKMLNNDIAILLATYNGERFLRVLLDSLYNQTLKDFTIYIHDDGSTDSTCDILNEYASKFDNIVILRDNIKNRGAKESFAWLLEHVDSAYYMFCDQDDVWLPDKVKLTYDTMVLTESENPDAAVAVITDLQVTDDDLNIIHPSMWKASKINTRLLTKFKYLSVYNLATGCTMMINSHAKKVSLPVSPKATMHDAWIALNVIHSGGVVRCIDKPTILYRQHNANTLGMQEINIRYFIRKLCNLNKIISDNRSYKIMVNEVKKISVFKYLRDKLAYYIKR